MLPIPLWAGPIRFKQSPARLSGLASMVSAAGLAPASFRLEGGGLNFSTTRSQSGPHGETPTRNPAFEAPHDCNFTTRGK